MAARTKEEILKRMKECRWWIYAYNHDYEEDDPANLAPDWEEELDELQKELDAIDQKKEEHV